MLHALGLPEIDLVVTDTGATGTPAELAAGRYLVTLENQTTDQIAGGVFLAVPAGTSDEDALDGILGDGLPTWFYDATWAGGPIAESGQMDAVVVELAAGDWWVDIDRTSTTDAAPPADTATKLTVTGEMTATEELGGTIPVVLSEYNFDIPATLAAGPQIWQVTNSGAQPHFLISRDSRMGRRSTR